MADDDAIWEFLRERATQDRPASSAKESASSFRRDSLVRLLDAAVGVLAATRRLVEVSQEILIEQRDRLATVREEDSSDVNPRREQRQKGSKIDLTY